MDTAPGVSGKDVQVVIHRDSRGGDIVLPADPTVVIRAADTPVLGQLVGDDIITADGTTLLGSDDKAGGVAMGVFTGFACVVTATAAVVLERVLQSAVDLKSDNDLTV